MHALPTPSEITRLSHCALQCHKSATQRKSQQWYHQSTIFGWLRLYQRTCMYMVHDTKTYQQKSNSSATVGRLPAKQQCRSCPVQPTQPTKYMDTTQCYLMVEVAHIPTAPLYKARAGPQNRYSTCRAFWTTCNLTIACHVHASNFPAGVFVKKAGAAA